MGLRIARRPALLAGAVLLMAASAAGWQSGPISGLTTFSPLHADDLLTGVDVHAVGTAAGGMVGPGGTNKKMTVSQLFGSPSNGNLIGWEGTASPILVGSGLTLTGTGPYTLSATSGAGTVNSGTSGQVAYYAGNGATVSGQALSGLMDAALGSAQGQVLYRAASGWSVLAPGTSGQVLTTGGPAANPTWSAAGGTGTVTSVAAGTGLTGGPITTTGSLSLAPITTGNVLANVSGSSAAPSAVAPGAVLDTVGSGAGSILYRGVGGWSALAQGTAGQVLTSTSSSGTIAWQSPGSGGTVTSVGLSAPGWLTVAGSPVATSGTITLTAAAGQPANQVLATPSGSTGAVGLRALTSADLPAGIGTVNSVGLSTPAWLTVSGSPVTGSGTLAVTATGAQTANQFLATPNGSTGTVGLRAVVAADLPTTGLTITQHAGTIAAPAFASTINLDLSTADWFAPAALTGNVTFTVSNPTVGQQFTVVTLQDGTGSRLVTAWFSGILWAGGSAPTLTTTASKRDVFTFKCISSGVYLGFVAGQNL